MCKTAEYSQEILYPLQCFKSPLYTKGNINKCSYYIPALGKDSPEQRFVHVCYRHNGFEGLTLSIPSWLTPQEWALHTLESSVAKVWFWSLSYSSIGRFQGLCDTCFNFFAVPSHQSVLHTGASLLSGMWSANKRNQLPHSAKDAVRWCRRA